VVGLLIGMAIGVAPHLRSVFSIIEIYDSRHGRPHGHLKQTTGFVIPDNFLPWPDPI